MKEFAGRCRELLAQKGLWEEKEIALPGKPDYDASVFKGTAFHPDGDERCTGCGSCVEVCPMKAIDRENPRKTDASRCISCGACIRVCPEKARDYRGEAYLAARKGFEEKCAARREAERFYIAS